jgi:membrane protease subunit HflC
VREEFGKRTVHEVVSGERDKIMDGHAQKANVDAVKIGVEIVDVRLKRVDLPTEVSEAVYRRMEAERKRVANELRSRGLCRGRKDSCRCRSPARNHRGGSLSRCTEDQG